MKTIKILGQEGRTAIPAEIRIAMGLMPGSIISFEMNGSEAVLRKEKLCDDCGVKRVPPKAARAKADTGGGEAAKAPLLPYLDSLSQAEQIAALIHLTDMWVRGREEDP